MSFAAPLWLVAAGLVAAGLIVAHLISTSVPQRDPFPTARFVPEGAPLTVLRTRRLTDLALLLLRLLAVVLLGLALAGARVAKSGPSRVVLADFSRAVASPQEVRDSVAALGGSPVVISFDSAVSREPLAESLAARPRGRLSAALVAAHRAMSGATKNRDKTELVIVSPIVREEVDSATSDLLRLWPGSVRHVRIAAAVAPSSGWTIRTSGDDPVTASLSREPRAEARIIRDTPTAADSAWARDSAGALVIWPSDLSTSSLARKGRADSAQGVSVGTHVVIGLFARTHDPRPGNAVAHWIDGMPAATETVLGSGCIRDVAIPVDRVGDLALRDNFRAMARALAAPCGGERDFALAGLPPSLISRAAPTPEAGARIATLPDVGASRVALWLAVVALSALVAEQLLRRRRRVA